jgi:hypothetical protein
MRASKATHSSEPLGSRANAGVHHGTAVFRGPEKKNPAVGTPGQIFFVIGVYGFKYAAWLLLVTPESAERIFLLSSQLSVLVLLLSCSSLTLRNLTEPFAISHRFLSVCALTRPWVGTTSKKQDTCPKVKKSFETYGYLHTARYRLGFSARACKACRQHGYFTMFACRVSGVA